VAHPQSGVPEFLLIQRRATQEAAQEGFLLVGGEGQIGGENRGEQWMLGDQAVKAGHQFVQRRGADAVIQRLHTGGAGIEVDRGGHGSRVAW
jgi:hypothetical protein